MPRKAYSYVRFSSGKQELGDSVRRQVAKRDEWLERKGVELDTTLDLSDLGVSAWKGDNVSTGALSVFLDLCKRGTIAKGSYLVVEHLDRLTRQQVRPALRLFMAILDAGITIVTLDPPREYSPDDKDALSLIEPLILFTAANDKSEILSTRLREAWAEKRQKREPMTRWVPAWLRLKADRSEYELIPEKAEIVRRIVKLSLDGFGDMRICRILNDEGVPVISDHRCWSNGYIAKLLKSPSLYGSFEPGTFENKKRVLTGEVWEDYFPAVISKDTWYLLRDSRRGRKTQRGPVGKDVANLFTGILFNGRDKESLHRIIKHHPRLVSAAYRNALSTGDTQSFPYDAFELAFLLMLRQDLKLQDLFSEGNPSEDTLSVLSAELTDLDHNIEEVKTRIKGEKKITAYLDVLADLEEQRNRVQEKLEEERAKYASRALEAEFLGDLQALAKICCEGKVTNELRTRLKAKIRQIVSEMWMLVSGLKRSKFKTADVQIFFRSGGSRILSMEVIRDGLRSADLYVPVPTVDFRTNPEAYELDRNSNRKLVATLVNAPLNTLLHPVDNPEE